MSTIKYTLAFIVALVCFGCLADDSFYQRYLSLVDTSGTFLRGHTSPLLVDTNNTTAKITNVVIRLDNLRTNGEFAGIHLGMTTDEVVARWGMPRGLQCSSATGPCLSFADTRLRFKGDALDHVYIPEAARFDHDLRGDSALKDWVRVLGEPTMRKDDQYGSSLVYETRGVVRTVLLLTFDPDGDMRFPPSLWREPDLTKWFKPLKP
jgi:hypothetical protein